MLGWNKPDRSRVGVIMVSMRARLETAVDEIIALKRDLDDAKTTEKFWRRCAEQALRLWEQAQDDKDDLCSMLALCGTIDQVHELLHDELTA